MNWGRIEGNWKQFKAKVREQWGKLTNDHSDAINGRREMLAGKLQKQYGITKEEAERDIEDWSASLEDSGQLGIRERSQDRFEPLDQREADAACAAFLAPMIKEDPGVNEPCSNGTTTATEAPAPCYGGSSVIDRGGSEPGGVRACADDE